MRREVTRITEQVERAIATATIGNPQDIRDAAAHLQYVFYGDDDAAAVVAAFVAMFQKSAERKERMLREAFGDKRS